MRSCANGSYRALGRGISGGRVRLADSVVIHLLHIESISSGMRNGSMVAPLAAIAAGGYGRRELAPGSDLDLLFLLPESSAGAVAPATRACIGAVVACLWDFGFVLDHATRSSRNASSLPRTIPPCLPAWLTGGTCGAVRACLLPSMPSLRRVSPDPTRDAGRTRSAALCRPRLAMHRAMCMPWRTSPT